MSRVPEVGGHAYGWVYPGPIGAVVSPVLVGLERAKDLPFASTLCGACREVCPVKINIPHMLLKLRGQLMESPSGQGRRVALSERLHAWAFHLMMSSPRGLGLVRRLSRVAQVPFVKDGRIRRLPVPPFSHWTGGRDLPALPQKPFSQLWREGLGRSTEASDHTEKGPEGEP